MNSTATDLTATVSDPEEAASSRVTDAVEARQRLFEFTPYLDPSRDSNIKYSHAWISLPAGLVAYNRSDMLVRTFRLGCECRGTGCSNRSQTDHVQIIPARPTACS